MKQQFEVYVLVEERMLLNLFGTINTQTFRGIPLQQSREDASSVRVDVIAEDQWIMQNLLVHHVGGFYSASHVRHNSTTMGRRTVPS